VECALEGNLRIEYKVLLKIFSSNPTYFLVRSKKSISKVTTSWNHKSAINKFQSERFEYFLESRPSSTNAVTIRNSGNSSLNAAIPSGAERIFKNRILDSGMPRSTEALGS
jgi:hypothetical protein